MYQRKLIIALSIFLSLIAIQAVATFWAFETLKVHNERSRAAQQMLTNIVHFRADAKRLQVWLGDFIIAEKRDTLLRDELFQRMAMHLEQIDTLNAQVFSSSQFYSDPSFSSRVSQKSRFLSENVTALKQALQTRQMNQLHSDAERWQTLVTLVDKFEGSDISSIVYNLITLHTEKSIQAEQDAASMSRFLFTSLILVSVISLLLFVALSVYLTRLLNQSLSQLTLGAERIKAKDFSKMIPETGSLEFVELAKAFNQMSASLKRSIEEQERLQNATEDKVLERTAQLQHVVNQLHDAEKRQKGFIAEVSHELRTPTTIIMGEAELALRTNRKQGQISPDSFERILECCHTLRSRIDDLILLSKGQHSLVSVKLQSISTTQLYQQLINQVALQSTHYPVDVSYPDAAQQILEATSEQLLIDTEKMDLVLRIILENAFQYQEKNPYISININIDAHQFHLYIIDKGIGITSHEHTQLFTRHARGDRAKNLRPEGLGIGLCIAKNIIDAHDGKLELTSNNDAGVTVHISLPLFDLEKDKS